MSAQSALGGFFLRLALTCAIASITLRTYAGLVPFVADGCLVAAVRSGLDGGAQLYGSATKLDAEQNE